MSAEDITQTVDAILSEATLAEKVGMMSGKGFFKQFAESGRRWGSAPYRAGGGIERLGVPALYFSDGPRGVARGNSTCFPCSMARGASFDPDLERRIGEAMGIEARAQGCNLSGAVCVNLLRHPAWGRAQETYGEDPYHVGEMGAALAQGIQTHNVIATVKHFAANSIENARFKVDVQIEARALHEVYLPHFKRILDAGCASVMSAYNKINGEYCGQNGCLLTDVLRDRWGFEGFVHSDWVLGVYDVSGATAGLDIENPEPRVWGKHLIAAVESGAVSIETIDQACRRILTTLYRFAAADDPLPDYPLSLVSNTKHVALAREAALKSAVLLKNERALPFARKDVQKLAVLGRLAALENTGDNGSSRVQPRHVVTALAGLTEAIAPNGVVLRGDERDLVRARAAAEAADAVVVVVGYTAREEGEYVPGDIALGQDGGSPEAIAQTIGGDRTSLRLPSDQVDLIRAVAGANPHMVIVLIAGSAVMIDEWVDGVPAVLQTFYTGMEGGAALASLLFGDESPSGKLPFTVPQQTEDLPDFDKDADAIVYDLWHGYWKLLKDERRPAFPFGFGLSYVNFAHRALRVRRANGCIEVQFSIRNLGAMPATEVAQLYVGPPGKEVDRPKLLLKGFERVHLEPDETRTVRFAISLDSLRHFDPEKDDWVLETGCYEIFAGGSSDTATLVRTHIVI